MENTRIVGKKDRRAPHPIQYSKLICEQVRHNQIIILSRAHYVAKKELVKGCWATKEKSRKPFDKNDLLVEIS